MWYIPANSEIQRYNSNALPTEEWEYFVTTKDVTYDKSDVCKFGLRGIICVTLPQSAAPYIMIRFNEYIYTEKV